MNLTQQKVVAGLQIKRAYPHRVSKITVEETHISWIFLTGSYAYKIKKDLKFGKVLDFSTLRLRKRFCQKEVRINRILCSDMYKGIVKVVHQNKNDNSADDYACNKAKTIRIKNLEHKGKALEYAVKMAEFPQKFRMDNLISGNKVRLSTIEKLVETLVKFHFSTPTGASIKNYGQPRFIKKKIIENFDTLSKLSRVEPKFEIRLTSFINNNKNLFYQRIRQNKIRDIHGDLYLKNIFIAQNRFYLYDRIEFNDSLRYADVTEDVAHLSMDLDYHKRIDLRKNLVDSYVSKTSDDSLKNLLFFWMCYKACVRAKVSLFHAKNERINKKRASYTKESNDLLELADTYLQSL